MIMGIAMAVLIAPPSYIYDLSTLLPLTLIGMGASWIPDIDWRFKHRKLLHNLLALIGFTVAFAYCLNILGFHGLGALVAVVVFAVGYLMHIVTDMLTVYGVAIFWPFSKSRYRLAKLRTDDKLSNAVLIILSVLLVVAKMLYLV